jgi:hypothetical protein
MVPRSARHHHLRLTAISRSQKNNHSADPLPNAVQGTDRPSRPLSGMPSRKVSR